MDSLIKQLLAAIALAPFLIVGAWLHATLRTFEILWGVALGLVALPLRLVELGCKRYARRT